MKIGEKMATQRDENRKNRFFGRNQYIPLRTIYLGIMYMDELYQMIIFALKHYDNWKDYIIGQIFHFVF